MDRARIILVLVVPLASLLASGCGSAPARGGPGGGPSPFEITDQSLFVQLDRVDYGLSVRLRDGPVWSGPSDFVPAISTWIDGEEVALPLRGAGRIEVLDAGGVGERKIHLRLSEFPHPSAEGIVIDLVVGITVGKDEFTVEVVPVRDPAGRLFGADYPPPLIIPAREEGYTVLPTMQGIRIPSDYPESLSYARAWWPDAAPDPSEPWWGGAVFSRACTMAWFGAVRGSHGYLAVIEDPYDATIDLDHPAGGPTRLRVRWRPSRGSLSYGRRIRYALFREADHVTLARRYREHARSSGHHRSLRDKLGARPVIGSLRGSVLLRADFPRVEEPIIVAKAGRAARAKGIERAILRLPRESGIFSEDRADDWKGFAGGLREAGWLLVAQVGPFGEYEAGTAVDREIAAWPSRQGSLGMMMRNRVIVGSSPEERGRLPQGKARSATFTTWYGGYRQRGDLVCPVPGLKSLGEALRAAAGRGIAISGVNLRDLSQVPLFDCFHTNHPLDKEGCAEALRGWMRRVSESGHVVCVDEPADFAFDLADLVDRGPYPRSRGIAGPARAIAVPLVSIVYHDAAVVAWDLDTGDDATDREQYLHAALTGGIGALPIDALGWLTRRRGGESEDHRGERESLLVERAKTLSKIHEAVWDQDLVAHEFVGEGGMVQRSRFANGARVEVDFRSGDISLAGVDPP